MILNRLLILNLNKKTIQKIKLTNRLKLIKKIDIYFLFKNQIINYKKYYFIKNIFNNQLFLMKYYSFKRSSIP